MPELAAILYAVAGVILAYKVGRFLVLGEQPPTIYGRDWL